VSARGQVTVAIVSDRRMRALNRMFTGQDTVTDVLSFPAVGPGERPGVRPARRDVDITNWLGDIVIAGGMAARQATALGHPVQVEARVLALHGLLHLLGYDHEADAGRMSRVESRLRRKGGLPTGLIRRTVDSRHRS
jgi:probable rRNA maturation factor